LPFLPYYIQELGVIEPDKLKLYVGLVSAAPALGMAIMAPIWGILSDRFGKKIMLLRAMLAAAIIISLMGFANSVNQLIFYRLLQGVFTGTVTAAAALVASATPRENLSFALGFMASSTFVGNSIGPLIGGIIASNFGYRASFHIGGIMMLLDFLLVLFLVKENFTVKQKNERNEKFITVIKSLITPYLLVLLATLFVMRITRTIFTPFMPLLVQQTDPNNSITYTSYISGLTGFVTALSGILAGKLGDKMDKAKLIKILIIASSLFAVMLYNTDNLFVFAITYSAMFFFSGGIEPLIMSMTALSVPENKRGALFGIQGTVGSIGFFFSPIIGSYISIGFGIKAVVIAIPILFIINLFVLSILRRTKVNDY
jgi:DHA1 family multidrug resistance protein-like MFS transporter